MAAEKEPSQVLRHVVLFSLKPTSSPADAAMLAQEFAKLPGQIEEIIDFEWGTDVSVEDKAGGYTHCFFVTFRDEAGRDTYLPHPAHKAFGQIVRQVVDKVLVLDYWARR